MINHLIAYFARSHLLTNLLFILVIVGGVFAWQNTNKEEMPEFTADFVRVSVNYPGAPAEDVEQLVTKPLEESIRGLDGVRIIESTSSVNSCRIVVIMEPDYPNIDEAITEIRNAVLDVPLPEEITKEPRVRTFRSSKKAIIDVALIHEDYRILDREGRQELQKYGLALENQLRAIPHVNSVNPKNYLQEEIQIKAFPEKLREYNIPINNVMQEIRSNHLRKPAGSIENRKEPKVTIVSELDNIDDLKDLIIQGGFEGRVIRLGEVADVRTGFAKNNSITKINGHGALLYNVVKNSSYGILDSIEAVDKVISSFRENSLRGTSIDVITLDDESIDIRNRLSIISINGAIGFALILIILCVFLNKHSGIWVAMGIPFTFCFTMIFASLLGHTINGTTLAAVIIVMGIVVDDAIIVAENISRCVQSGMSQAESAIRGTAYVLMPITASILTTCIAFVPLFFFGGFFGRFVSYIPPIIFLMLGASLLESILILPGHMNLIKSETKKVGHWFESIENLYGKILNFILPLKWLILLGFIGLLGFSLYIAKEKMRFVIFPNEETRDIVINGNIKEGSTRYETAAVLQPFEDMLVERFYEKEVVGFRTRIAKGRRGGVVNENHFRINIEIVPREARNISADQFVSEIEEFLGKHSEFENVKIRKSRWHSDSGSPIDILIQQNNDPVRLEIAKMIKLKMESHSAFKNVEIDEALKSSEYQISIDREKIKRLSINTSDIASTLRAALEGTILYEFTKGDEDVNVRFTLVDEAKDDIDKVLSVPVENRGNYLVPLKDVVHVKEVISPNVIQRRDLKRTTHLDSDLNDGVAFTALEAAEWLEANVFPEILSKFPTTTLAFTGEIENTRESKNDMRNAIIMVIFLIFAVLALLFNSLVKPLMIMLAIPFGVVGVIIAFWLHDKDLYGFFAAIGTLGLAGVVINDSIIMLVKLDKEYKPTKSRPESVKQISQIAKTRLRAVILTTITTVAGVMPTAYGFAGYDDMLAEMMLALAWGMVFGTLITLILIPCVFSIEQNFRRK